MKMKLLPASISIAAAGILGPLSVFAEDLNSVPPVVTRTVPEAGSNDIAAGELVIKITFSKPMADQSWSWADAWQGSAPEILEKPRYEADRKTCVMKVKVQPGRTYGWWLNSQKFQGFRDAQNHPAVPYLLTFQTK
jgi:hypothetical protein